MRAALLAVLLALGCSSRETRQPGPAPTPLTLTESESASGQTALVAAAPDAGTALPEQGAPCRDGQCAEGLVCRARGGLTAPRAGQSDSGVCERLCGVGGCPEGQICTTVSDGPGRVCRKR